jgi:hypothetical protein
MNPSRLEQNLDRGGLVERSIDTDSRVVASRPLLFIAIDRGVVAGPTDSDRLRQGTDDRVVLLLVNKATRLGKDKGSETIANWGQEEEETVFFVTTQLL